MNNKSFYPSYVMIVLPILTGVFSILYLGPWSESDLIDPSDWKRKWILFFAWFNLIFLALMFFFAYNWLSLMFFPVALVILSIPVITSILVIVYLGPWDRDSTDMIDPTDWKRKWILFFAWFDVAFYGFVLLCVPFLPKTQLQYVIN